MRILAFDTETSSTGYHGNDMFAFSTCTPDGQVGVHRLDGSLLRQVQSRKALEATLADDVLTVSHNAKFDMKKASLFLGRNLLPRNFHCTYLMSNILRNNHHNYHRLKDLAWELAGIPKDDERRVKPYLHGERGYQAVPEEIFTEYQKRDGIRCMLLYLFMQPKVYANPKWRECYETERDLVAPTIAMENRGVMLNRTACKKTVEKLHHDVEKVLDEIEGIMGQRIKPSQERFRWALYRKFGIPIKEEHTTRTGKPSMDKDYLLELRQEYPLRIIDLAMMYTSWTHGISILEAYQEYADGNDLIHPCINTCKAVTCRQSSSDPNLHNVEKEGVLKNPFPVPARRAFRPRPGYVNFHLDYSGQEMRILIHASGDEELVKIANEGGDLHMPGVRIFYPDFDSLPEDEQKSKRNAGKNTNFAIGYGAAWPKACKTANIPISEAGRVGREYKARFPKFCGLMQQNIRLVKGQGYIETAFGRRLYIPRNEGYVGTNFYGQGTGAELMKRGTIRVSNYLDHATAGEMGIILTIHDEMIIQCPRTRIGDAKPILRECCRLMTDFPGVFRVPFIVECKVATYDWQHKEKFSLA